MANLFKYATSELSQDAFLCWLFASLNDDSYSEKNKQIKLVARTVLFNFLDINDVGQAVSIRWISKQWRKIDIIVEALIDNELYILAIEDKYKSEVHNSSGTDKCQLDFYYDALESHWMPDNKKISKHNGSMNQNYVKDKEHIKCVLYKTSFLKNKDLDNYPKWKKYGIKEIISLFKDATKNINDIESDILDSYVSRLNLIDETFKTNSKVNNWIVWQDSVYEISWQNLFHRIFEQINDKYSYWDGYYNGTYYLVSIKSKDKDLPAIEFQPRQFEYTEDSLTIKFLIQGNELNKNDVLISSFSIDNIDKWQSNLKLLDYSLKNENKVRNYVNSGLTGKKVNNICSFRIKLSQEQCEAKKLEEFIVNEIIKIFAALDKND